MRLCASGHLTIYPKAGLSNYASLFFLSALGLVVSSSKISAKHSGCFQPLLVFIHGSQGCLMWRFTLVPSVQLFCSGGMIPLLKTHFKSGKVSFQKRIDSIQGYSVKYCPGIYQVLNIGCPFYNGLNSFPRPTTLKSVLGTVGAASCGICLTSYSGKFPMSGSALMNCSNSLRAT